MVSCELDPGAGKPCGGTCKSSSADAYATPTTKTIVLHGWHSVVMNTEGPAKAMKNVVFLGLISRSERAGALRLFQHDRREVVCQSAAPRKSRLGKQLSSNVCPRVYVSNSSIRWRLTLSRPRPTSPG